jgi:hypothetical protein
MKKALMIGAMAVAAFVTASQSAQAKKAHTYGYYSFSGGAYCNTITLTVSGSFASGISGYYQADCPYASSYVGGYEGSLKYFGSGKWFTLVQANNEGAYLGLGYSEVNYINLKTLTWYLAITNSYYGIPLEVINGGLLGAPLSKSGGTHLGPVSKAFAAKFKAEHHAK